MDLLDTKIYGIIGEEGFQRLVAGFYRQVPTDEILGPMYPKGDLSAAEARLREFLIQRFGGPHRYSQQRGHPRLRMRHVRFHIDQRARDRWISLMKHSLEQMNFTPQVNETLASFFESSATFLINQA
jgi:hemoglobin